MKWEVRTMRSGTSFFNWTVFKKTICRFWPLWASYFAIWLVTLPLNGLMTLRMDAQRFTEYSYTEEFAFSRLPNAASETSLTLAVIFGALAAMAVFSHLYNARSANLFGSLPVKREGMFITHYLAGLAFLIVPNAVIFLLCLLVEAAGSCVCLPALLFWLAVSCGECFLFYSMAVFCAMFTGHILALPAFYAILNGLAAGVVSLVQLVFHIFYYGYYGYELPRIVLWLTPVVQLGQSVQGYSHYAYVTDSGPSDQLVLVTRGLDVVGIYAAAALALTVCAFLLYRARRLESAGDVVAIQPMKPVFKYGVAFCAGLTLGMGTIWFTSGGEIAFVIATVIWGVIGYFAAEMLLQKSFKVFRKWKGAVAAAAVFAALFLAVSFDFTGFETRIPDPATVDSVNVFTANVVYFGDNGDNIYMDVTDPEVIGLLNILHQEAVAQRDEERQTQAQVGGISTGLSLRYTLNEGGTLSRRYTVWLNPDDVNREGTAAWAVQQLYDNHELYWQVYGFDELESVIAQGGRLENASYGSYDDEYGSYEQAIFYGHDASALLAAVREDFFAGRIAVRRVDDEKRWYGGGPENSLTFEAVGQERSDGSRPSWSVNIAIQDTASSTLAALEEMADRAVRPGTEGYWE